MDTDTAVLISLIGQLTVDQIAELKTKYKAGIYAVIIDGHIGYFQNPNRIHMNISMSKASADAALDMYEMLAKLTMIGGSEVLLTDDAMFFGLTQHLKTKMDGKKGQLVNL
jgi:hypothetical protein